MNRRMKMHKDITPREARLFLLMGFIIGIEVIYFLVFSGAVAYGCEQGTLMNVSAYCGGPCCCGKWADGRTASNHKIREGDRFVAAPKRYPFGTKMIVPGYNDGQVVEVKDRGGAIKGNCLDLFFNDHQAALEWGRQQVYVRIVR
jgi:3D (Asp-Asp-Asp) domain-containing protein